jgi:hypothetical protein
MAAASTPGDRPAAIWRRAVPRNLVGVLAICGLFGALLVGGVYFATEPSGALKAPSIAGAGGLPGAMKAVPLVGAASLGPNDPVVRFSDTRIGQVLYARTSSDNCERVLFDNRSGAYYDSKEIFCGQTPSQVSEAETPNRLMALRKSFTK